MSPCSRQSTPQHTILLRRCAAQPDAHACSRPQTSSASRPGANLLRKVGLGYYTELPLKHPHTEQTTCCSIVKLHATRLDALLDTTFCGADVAHHCRSPPQPGWRTWNTAAAKRRTCQGSAAQGCAAADRHPSRQRNGAIWGTALKVWSMQMCVRRHVCHQPLMGPHGHESHSHKTA